MVIAFVILILGLNEKICLFRDQANDSIAVQLNSRKLAQQSHDGLNGFF